MKRQIDVEERVASERAAHEQYDVLAESHKLKGRFPHILRYPSRKRIDAYLREVSGSVAGKTVLDYGCGRGEVSLEYLRHGATVYGIDIASNYIETASESAAAEGYPAHRFRFEVMDAHELRFDAETFDYVIGNGILHHLDADRAMKEIHRVLKPGGRVLLFEPLAGNPLLKLFRWVTPRARTKDERPFSRQDVERLTGDSRWLVETTYCGVIEAPLAMLTSVVIPRWPENWLLRAGDTLEQQLHARGFLKAWNQYILFNLVKPPA